MTRRLAMLLMLVCAIAIGDEARAHKASDSYLWLESRGTEIDLRWDIALRDLEIVIGIDADHDRRITWAEVQAQQARIDAYALSHLTITADDTACAATATAKHLIDSHSDGGYLVIRQRLHCTAQPAALRVDYNLLFEADRSHRGLVNVSTGDIERSAVLGESSRTVLINLTQDNAFARFTTFVREGVHHIWIGYDHILFLVSLLLAPAVVGTRTTANATHGNGDSLMETFKIVSAFTVAHSVTLALAASGTVTLPPALIEIAIAASVVIAAINNLRALLPARIWLVAFVFGFVHGFGFANVLAELNTPGQSFWNALLGFNVGVELGQIVIVAAIWPLLRWIAWYPAAMRRTVTVASAAIAGLATLWVIDRSIGLWA